MQLSDRINDVCRMMEREKVDALVVAASGVQSIDHNDPVFHLSGYRPLGPSLFVLRSDETSTLIVSPAHDVERAAERSRAANCVGTADPVVELPAAIKGVPLTRVGTVNLEGVAHGLGARIVAALPGGRSLDAAFHTVGAVKTDEEIENVRKATWIAERGYERLLAIGHAGMIECELALDLRLYMQSLGADDNFLMFNALPHNRGVQASSTRQIVKGDIVLAEITPTYCGQFSQICRTISVGPPSNTLSDKYAMLVRGMKDGIAAVKPGAMMGEVCTAIDGVLSAEGYAEYCKPPYIRRRGHGLGFGSMLPGDVRSDNRTVLEPNMFFVVHPNQYLPETGYLMCGDPLRVTDTGVEIVTQKIAELAVIPA